GSPISPNIALMRGSMRGSSVIFGFGIGSHPSEI
ncbi:MAG: hypothetical protein ACI9ON_003050, partial [Limisphaerales bacterium]